ncbi:putative DD41D transposase [Trichonephila clavipes]|nr:putative DD41D transposase [Trichonephila clavipes]
MCIKLKNDIPVCQRTRRLSCSDNPSPMKSKYRRLRTEHLKGMKIHPDKTRSYVQCKHCSDLQLTPNHILECPTIGTKLLKMGMVPEKRFGSNKEVSVEVEAYFESKDKSFCEKGAGHHDPVNWPPRSCDLTPLDYFLWGYVKLLVYADEPQTLDHLEDNICRVIADIRPQMLEKVIENWTSRLDYIRASRGSHMPEIIFKM